MNSNYTQPQEIGRLARFKGSDSIGRCNVRVLKEFGDICEVIPEGNPPAKWPYTDTAGNRKRRSFNVSPDELS